MAIAKKNENQEWAESLQALGDGNKKQTMQAIIVAMTSGRDVSWIFSDVVKCIYTKDLELKKLIYLYLITYARTQPETSILAVNYFLKDAENTDSSIFRGVAIRTMSAIPLQQMAEYLVEPLTKAMKDSDPYVRKVAALAAAKLHEVSPEACANNGVMNILADMAVDQNQAVVANAIAAILDIAKRVGQKPNITESIYSCCLAAIAEVNEWGLVSLLEIIPFITPNDQYMAISALEKISTKLQHANAAVVINSIRAILHLIKYVEEDTRQQYARRITPSFITLLSTESTEVQYMALRCTSSVLAAFPTYLKFDLRIFLPKYHDPIYVKYEKLDLILQISTDENAQLILNELKDYCFSEVDAIFVKKCVRTIGKIGVKLVNQAGQAVQTLVELVKQVNGQKDNEDGQVFVSTDSHNQTSYTAVAQEALVAIRDTIRCYPGYFEGAIVHVLQAVQTVDDPEARAALFFIIGEHAKVIENAYDLLKQFITNFSDENETVQLALLTACVKVFLSNSNEDTQALVKDVLTQATSLGKNVKGCSPDVRERGFFYWRLLSLDTLDTAKKVVFGASQGYDREKATRIVDAQAAFNQFVPSLGTYSCIARQAVRNVVKAAKKETEEMDDVVMEKFDEKKAEEKPPEKKEEVKVEEIKSTVQQGQKPDAKNGQLEDLLGF